MLAESRQLIANFDKYFLRKYQWQYHLMIVDNHYYDRYGFFMQAHRSGELLHYSYDLLEMAHDPDKYQQVLADLRNHTKMRIEFRNTHQLVHPGQDIVKDVVHGHGHSTVYHQG